MTSPDDIASIREQFPTDTNTPLQIGWTALIAFLPLIVFVGSVAAAPPGTATPSGPGGAFCGTDMAKTIRNIFTLIQFGGPLIGGVLALGATVVLPSVRRSDWKKELKTIRNQGLFWGVIVAPLGTRIVQFLLNHMVAGGTSCGF